MARAASTDFMHNFRFHAKVKIGDSEQDVLSAGVQHNRGSTGSGLGNSEAGFNSVSMPEYTVEQAEYRDGITTHTRVQPGYPTTNEITFSRGVVQGSTQFLDWAVRSFNNTEYRADIQVFQWQKTAIPEDPKGAFDLNSARVFTLFEAFPVRVKPASDFDATSTDITLKELDVKFEHFDIEDP